MILHQATIEGIPIFLVSDIQGCKLDENSLYFTPDGFVACGALHCAECPLEYCHDSIPDLLEIIGITAKTRPELFI